MLISVDLWKPMHGFAMDSRIRVTYMVVQRSSSWNERFNSEVLRRVKNSMKYLVKCRILIDRSSCTNFVNLP